MKGALSIALCCLLTHVLWRKKKERKKFEYNTFSSEASSTAPVVVDYLYAPVWFTFQARKKVSVIVQIKIITFSFVAFFSLSLSQFKNIDNSKKKSDIKIVVHIKQNKNTKLVFKVYFYFRDSEKKVCQLYRIFGKTDPTSCINTIWIGVQIQFDYYKLVNTELNLLNRYQSTTLPRRLLMK